MSITLKITETNLFLIKMDYLYTVSDPNLDFYASNNGTLPPFVKIMQSFILMQNT